jgi:hypothetical protein
MKTIAVDSHVPDRENWINILVNGKRHNTVEAKWGRLYLKGLGLIDEDIHELSLGLQDKGHAQITVPAPVMSFRSLSR